MTETRPADPDDENPDAIVRDWYDNHYSKLTATADDSFFANYMHKTMERRFGPETTFDRVLEVGGNRGEHIPFVRHGFSEYLLTDLYAPKLLDSLVGDRRITTAACNAEQTSLPGASFDRVISTCLLHHVDSPFRAVVEMRRVTRPGGTMTILVPTDPGLAYRVGKAITSGRAARREGLSDRHRLLGALDHHNHFLSIKEQITYVTRHDVVTIDWLPWRVPVMNLNAFAVFTITKSA